MPIPIKRTGRVLTIGPGVRALNRDLVDSLGRIRDPEPKRDSGPALVKKQPGPKNGKCGVAGGGPQFRVTIVSFRHGTLNSDNIAGGAKRLRDLIADTLNLAAYDPDNDKLVEWEVEQVKTRGRTGTLVRIERL